METVYPTTYLILLESLIAMFGIHFSIIIIYCSCSVIDNFGRFRDLDIQNLVNKGSIKSKLASLYTIATYFNHFCMCYERAGTEMKFLNKKISTIEFMPNVFYHFDIHYRSQ